MPGMTIFRQVQPLSRSRTWMDIASTRFFWSLWTNSFRASPLHVLYFWSTGFVLGPSKWTEFTPLRKWTWNLIWIHPMEKEHHLFESPFFGFYVIFPGVNLYVYVFVCELHSWIRCTVSFRGSIENFPLHWLCASFWTVGSGSIDGSFKTCLTTLRIEESWPPTKTSVILRNPPKHHCEKYRLTFTRNHWSGSNRGFLGQDMAMGGDNESPQWLEGCNKTTSMNAYVWFSQ